MNNNNEEQKGTPLPWTPEEEELIGKYLSEAVRKTKEKRAELLIPLFKIPEPEWIVEGIAVSQGISILYGNAGMGKTSLALQLIGSIKERIPFLGLKTHPIEVLFVSQDENPSLLAQHIKSILREYPSLSELAVPIGTIEWDKDTGNFTSNLLDELIKVTEAGLIVIDSLTSLGMPDINQPKVSFLFDKLRERAKEYNCAFVLLHHPNKGGDIMGSNLIKAKCDCLLSLKPDKAVEGQLKDGMEMELTFEKVRGSHPENLKLIWSESTLTYSLHWHSFIENMRKKGVKRKEAVDTVMQEYGHLDLKRDTVGKFFDRAKKGGE